MRIAMGATNGVVVLDLKENELHMIRDLAEMDRHIDAMKQARAWLKKQLNKDKAPEE